MNPVSAICPKCQGAMIQGFVTDAAYNVTGVTVGNWVEGSPAKFFLGGIKLKGKKKCIPIATYRCSKCGYLEAYARPEFAAE